MRYDDLECGKLKMNVVLKKENVIMPRSRARVQAGSSSFQVVEALLSKVVFCPRYCIARTSSESMARNECHESR